LLFSERIYKAYLDTSTNLLTVQLRKTNKEETMYRKKGKIVQYDMENDKILWTKDINHITTSVYQYKRAIFLTTNGLSYCINIFTGDTLWGGTHDIYFTDPEFNIALGYRSGYNDENHVLEGINLKNGKIAWQRKVSRVMGWNNLFYTNDSTLLIAANGLHSINLKTGKGWDYDAVTYEKENSFFGGYSLIKSYTSDMWVDTTSVYFTSKNEIIKLDKEAGEVVWKTEISKSNAGGSALIMGDSVIYWIHKGYDYSDYLRKLVCAPFIAAFDNRTGEQQYIAQPKVNQLPFLAYTVWEDELYLLFKNQLAKYDLKTGNIIKNALVDNGIYGNLKFFASERVFITNKEGDFTNIWEDDTTNLYVFNHRSELLAVDKNLNINKVEKKENIIVYNLSTNDYGFLSPLFYKDEKTYVVNNDRKIIDIFKLSYI
jgi:hypothetical protein